MLKKYIYILLLGTLSFFTGCEESVPVTDNRTPEDVLDASGKSATLEDKKDPLSGSDEKPNASQGPILSEVVSQIVYVGNAITEIDLNDDGDDLDVDGFTLSYSCNFTSGESSTQKPCSDLPGSSSFDQTKGTIAWTPDTSAVDGENAIEYSFTVSATNDAKPPKSISKTFIITAKPRVVLGVFSDRLFPDAPHIQSTELNIDFNNIYAETTGDDDGMTYDCTFDTSLDSAVDSGSNCNALPGEPTSKFDTTTGVFSWTPSSTDRGSFEIKISATHASGSSIRVFKVTLKEPYPVTHLKASFEPTYAAANAPATGNPSSWEDLSGNDFDATLYLTSAASWIGDGNAATPYALELTGSEHMKVADAALSGETKYLVTMWMEPEDITEKSFLMSEGNQASGGWSINQNASGDGSLVFKTGDLPFTSYSQEVLADTPIGYWRLGESSGPTADDISTNDNDGTYSGTVTHTGASGLDDDLNSSAYFTGSGHVDVSIPQIDTTPGNFVTVEFWMKWNGSGSIMPVGFTDYDIYIHGGNIGFNTASADVFGVSDAGLAGNWVHVVAAFKNGNAQESKLYFNGIEQSLSLKLGTPAARNVTTNVRIAGWVNNSSYRFQGNIDEFAIYNGLLSQERITKHYEVGRQCISAFNLENDKPSLIATTYDGTESKLYINGREQCAQSSSHTPGGSGLRVGTNHLINSKLKGKVFGVKVYSTNDGTSPGNENKIRDIFRATANRFRATPMESDPLSSEYILHLDPANAQNGLEAPSTGCTATWYDLSNGGNDPTLNNFSSCDANSGWSGNGTPASPYRIELDGNNDYLAATIDEINTDAGARTSVAFWMKWAGNSDSTPISFGDYGLFIPSAGDCFGINTSNSDCYGVSATGLSNTWLHVVVEFHNGDAKLSKLYINGTAQTLTQRVGVTGSQTLTSAFKLGDYGTPGNYMDGAYGQMMMIGRALTQAEITTLCNQDKDRYSGAVCN